jgi:hypothetical protein
MNLRFCLWVAALGLLATSCAQAATYKVTGPYLGCWRDAVNRVLPTPISAPNMTVGKCVASCQDRGFSYAGLQNGSQCFCGNSYQRLEKLDDSNCQTPCAGNHDESCGGWWANSVYSTGVKQP